MFVVKGSFYNFFLRQESAAAPDIYYTVYVLKGAAKITDNLFIEKGRESKEHTIKEFKWN